MEWFAAIAFIALLIAIGLTGFLTGVFARRQPQQPAPPAPPTPPAVEEDIQRVLTRQMVDDSRRAANELAAASNELWVARVEFQAESRRDEASRVRNNVENLRQRRAGQPGQGGGQGGGQGH